MTHGRGITRERQVRQQLEEQGWVVSRCAGSKGNYDLMASRKSKPYFVSSGAVTATRASMSVGPVITEVRLVEVKSTAGGPYERFGPAARAALKAAADQAGATAWLAYWPKGGKLRWIEASQWP